MRIGAWFRSVGFAMLALTLVTLGTIILMPATADAATCPIYQFIGVRGSGESSGDGDGYGPTVNAFRKSMAAKIPGGEAKAIDYPAIPVAPGLHYKDDYRLSINAGINSLQSFMAAFHTRCQSTPIVLTGYSQGAQVAGDVYQSINQGARDKTTLVLFGDPRFNPGQPQVNAGNYDSSRHGIWSKWFNGYGNTDRSFRSTEYASVRSYCLYYDPVCNWTAGNFVNCLPKLYCVHTKYIEFGYTDDAAKWVLSRLPAPPAAAPAPLSPTSARVYPYRVIGTGGIGLRVRPGPAATGTPLYRVDEGGTLNIICQAHGQRVLPGSDIWDRLAGGGWAYDWYATTLKVGAFSPPIPVC